MAKKTTPEEKFTWLTTAPIPGLIGRLAVPTIISMLITSIYNMADTYFVGELGTSAQGAVGVVFSLMAIIQAIGFTFGNGTGNHVSRLLGAQEGEKAEYVASTGFFMGVLAGAALTVVGILFLDPLVSVLGATETILPYARDYARFILIGAPWMVGSLVLNNLFRFEGSTTYAMVGITTGGILNMLLDPIFIFERLELFGFTIHGIGMGTGGAALATIVSQFISFLILLANCGRNGNLPIKWSRFSLREGAILTSVKGGMPSLYRQGLASVASILLNWAAKPFGDAAIAAMGIVSKVNMFSGSAIIGFGQGFQPFCGFNFGAGLYKRVREGFWFCVKVGFAVLVVIGTAMFLLAPQVVTLFNRNDPQVIRLGTMALRCQMVALPLVAWVVTNNMMLQTVGETARASVTALARQGLFFIPLILVLPRFFDFNGVMLSQPISDVCSAILTIPLCFGFLKKMDRLEAEKETREG